MQIEITLFDRHCILTSWAVWINDRYDLGIWESTYWDELDRALLYGDGSGKYGDNIIKDSP